MNVMVKQVLHDTRIKIAAAVVLVVVVSAIGWVLYSSYRNRINEQAQFTFAMQLDALERLRQDKAADQAAWETAEQNLARAYEEHASSNLAPFYEALQSEVALREGKHAQAIELLEKAVRAMGSSNPLYYLYKTKLEIMRIDAPDAALQQEGSRGLRALADDIHNPHRGYAWYQIWHYAWVAGDKPGYEEAFAKLSSFQSQGSQWGKLAQAKMDFVA